MFSLVQISDTHLVARPDGTVLGCPVRRSLEAVVAAIGEDAGGEEHALDAVLVTGDLSQDGTPASYEALGQLLRPLGVPCWAFPGNHDERPALEAALGEAPFRSDREVRFGDWRALLLDSKVEGETYGRLTPDALAALDDALAAAPGVPTLLALHHPPVKPGVAWLDPLCLREPGPLLDLVARHEQVRLVLAGHIHQVLDARHAQARILMTPATCFQFAPDADDFALDTERPAGYRRLTLFSDGRFDTRVERIARTYTLDTDASGY